MINERTNRMTLDHKLELPEREHLTGCPAERLERFEAVCPSGQRLIVVRCIECGGQQLFLRPDEESL
jgi:hypothetical protein